MHAVVYKCRNLETNKLYAAKIIKCGKKIKFFKFKIY